MKSAREWIASNGWTPLPFQEESWRLFAEGGSALVYSSTGTGKTYAAWLGLVEKELNQSSGKGLKALWITPLRALAADTTQALNRPLEALGIPWRAEQRTGDTSSSARQRQMKNPPGALVTTPETLCLMLSQKDGRSLLGGLELVVVDEWHELLGSKRGTQTELGLARLRQWNPTLRTWGLSATIGNVRQAADVLRASSVISGEQKKEIEVRALLPEKMERFPWAGHLGRQMMPRVSDEIEQTRSALVFTNTRSQAELWFQSLEMLLPEFREQIAIHHGSLDRDEREFAEDGLRAGRLRAVVCTSSLDLGVDFSPVDRVFQVGSAKGVGRLIQRAGRSGHQPGEKSVITMVPTNGMELMEIAALSEAVARRQIEDRIPPRAPLDVLVQHLVTIALGGGFDADDLYKEVCTCSSYEGLTRAEFDWCLDFVVRGGASLSAYSEYRKVEEEDGRYVVKDRRIALQHRLSIGTIVSDTNVKVAYISGATIGTVEESFATRLRPGDKFVFAGKPLEFVRMKDLTCYVRRTKSTKGRIVRWAGARMSLSMELSNGLRQILDRAASGELVGEAMVAAREVLALQADRSAIPHADELLIEQFPSREGYHLVMYPLEGRQVHEGLAALFTYRLSRRAPLTFTFSANDYGFELLSADPFTLREEDLPALFSSGGLTDDLLASLNAAELAKRQFREVARIAGLVFQGYPGAPKTSKQLQASSGTIYDVFKRYEPGNLLLGQAEREVLEKDIQESRLALRLGQMAEAKWKMTYPERATPFAFPMMVSRLRETLSSEEVEDRIKKMIAQLEAES